MEHDCGVLHHDQIDRAVNPVGTFIWKASLTVPDGYLLCDGSAVSRTKYAALFKDIGTTFGVGDGTTTFTLPDMRGVVPVGYKSTDEDFNTVGHTGGHKALAAHTHPYSDEHLTKAAGNSPDYAAGGATQTVLTTDSKTTGPTGTGDSGNLQPYIALPAFIKY